jgi:D-alanyl-lipoteichoic acid acyltransferase DltB (MBOAT superfamily)
MLFNSFEFILAFLPLTLIGFFFIGRSVNRDAAIAFLVLASMFFYAWWRPIYLLLIVGEICMNFALGRALMAQRDRLHSRALITVAIALNIGILGYFKYTLFLVGVFNQLTGTDYVIGAIILPLGISFHTFQQIAYLVDVYRGSVPRYRFLDYVLFVTFFPQLIAGPIVHHDEMLPQISSEKLTRFRLDNLCLGLSIFAIGLFKKTVIADSLAQIATPAFGAAAHAAISPEVGWLGALAYTFQLYFDFSAYSDMATGLARMFNIVLPANFDSPYKAVNIADFWRRWHITLSRFLRDYLYIPLGGNRNGQGRAMVYVMITMLIGGLWHGAGWTFVAWGGLHGIYIVLHRLVRRSGLYDRLIPFDVPRRVIGQGVTLLLVVVAWVFFRASSFGAAGSMLSAMLGFGAGASPDDLFEINRPWLLVAAAGAVALFAPNVIDMFAPWWPVLPVEKSNPRRFIFSMQWVQWRPTWVWGLIVGAWMSLGTLAILGWQSEFLYFQF